MGILENYRCLIVSELGGFQSTTEKQVAEYQGVPRRLSDASVQGGRSGRELHVYSSLQAGQWTLGWPLHLWDSSLHNRKQQKAAFFSYLGLGRGTIMDNKGEEAGLCGLAGLTGAVEGVFARKLAWRIPPDKSSMVKSRVSGHSVFLQLHREV